MLERLINVTKTTFFIKNDNFLLKIKNSSQYVLQFLFFHLYTFHSQNNIRIIPDIMEYPF